MAQRDQRGWLKKEKRAQGETWVLFFRTTRQSDGKTGGKQNPYKLGPTPFRRKQCMVRGRTTPLGTELNRKSAASANK
jgi:hypothetical protein